MIPDPTDVQGRRIAAWTIDLVSFLLLVFVVLMATGGVSWHSRPFPSPEAAIDYCEHWDRSDPRRGCLPWEDEAIIVNVKGTSPDVVWLGYFLAYCFLQGLTGWSPGKLIMGLRAVDEDGRRCGIGRSIVRTIMWIVDAITCGLPIVGGVFMTSTPGHRRVGDKTAKTYVVDKKAMGSPIVIPAPLPPAYPYPYAYGPPGYPPPGYPPHGYPPPPPPPPTPVDGPHWDEARDTYIQYDRHQEAWLQWDEAREEWKPIDA